MAKYNYYLGENYLKTKKYLYCIKTYNVIFSEKSEFDVYMVNEENRFTLRIMASNNFKTGHIEGLNKEVFMFAVKDRLKKAILKRIGG
jgi:hypothetical protein